MPDANAPEPSFLMGEDAFVTTHWSVVVAAGQPGNQARDEALGALCRAYWRPIYIFVRRRGHGHEMAQDLTQEFFARLLAKEWLAGIEPRASRFRSFLLKAVSRFLANEYDRSVASKRGGGIPLLNLDQAEGLYDDTWASLPTPEHTYDRSWALAVIAHGLSRLREEAGANDKLRSFDRLSPFLSREPAAGEYEAVAAELALTSNAVGVMILRMRRRYRDVVRAVIAETVSSQEDVDAELRYLVEILRQ